MQQAKRPTPAEITDKSAKNKIKKRKIDARVFLQAKGMKPTPLNFYKLVVNEDSMHEFFCYCNRKVEFYDFEVVPFEEKNESEYLTVSKRGFTHYIKG
jgi:hypothetical protein